MSKYKIIQLVALGTMFSNVMFAQTKIKRTFYKNGRTESINHKTPDNSTKTLTFYLNGNLKKEINIKDNKLNGRQITYDSLGRKITESFENSTALILTCVNNLVSTKTAANIGIYEIWGDGSAISIFT